MKLRLLRKVGVERAPPKPGAGLAGGLGTLGRGRGVAVWHQQHAGCPAGEAGSEAVMLPPVVAMIHCRSHV